MTHLTVEVTFPGKTKRQVPAEKVLKTLGPGMAVYVDTPEHMNGYEFHQLINGSWIALETTYDRE